MGNKKPKVIIALACQNTVMARCAFSLVHAVKDANFEVDMLLRMGCDIVGSRIWLAKKAKEIGGTHILFVDDDMSFAPDTIKRMLAHKKEIVGAAYNFRSLPLKSTAVPIDAEPVEGVIHKAPDTLPKELFKCRSLGAGLLLIDLSVFDKLPEPWFMFGRKADGDLAYGEDTHFCRLATAAGFDIYADPTLSVTHVGEYMY